MQSALRLGYIVNGWQDRGKMSRPKSPITSKTIEISCLEVWQQVSNYLENDVDPVLRARLDEHFAKCNHCFAIVDGTRNVMQLVGDGRSFELPANFSKNLYSKLEEHLSKK